MAQTPNLPRTSKRPPSESNRRANALALQREWPRLVGSVREDVERRAQARGGHGQRPEFQTLVSTQTDFIRETSQAYLGAFKERMK